MKIDFAEYQEATGSTAIYPREQTIEYLGLGLAGEAGEVAGKIKKVMRDDHNVYSIEKSDEIAAELGDVLWYLARLADELGYDLEEIAYENLAKLSSRKARGALQGSGDTR